MIRISKNHNPNQTENLTTMNNHQNGEPDNSPDEFGKANQKKKVMGLGLQQKYDALGVDLSGKKLDVKTASQKNDDFNLTEAPKPEEILKYTDDKITKDNLGTILNQLGVAWKEDGSRDIETLICAGGEKFQKYIWHGAERAGIKKDDIFYV